MKNYRYLIALFTLFLIYGNSIAQNPIKVFENCMENENKEALIEEFAKYDILLVEYGVNFQSKKEESKYPLNQIFTYPEIATNSIIDGHVNYNFIAKKHFLKGKNKKAFLELLFATKAGEGTFEQMRCYNPRQGIIFLEKKKEVKYNIEVSFECMNGYIKGEGFPNNIFCKKMWMDLEPFMMTHFE